MILVLDGQCAAHIMHREVERCFGSKQLIPKLYATAWSCSLPSTYNEVIAAIESIVAADMAVGFFPNLEPPPELAARTSLMAELTLLRCKFVSSQIEDGDYVSEDLQALFIEFRTMLNGDHRVPRLQHCCHSPGCCDGHDRSVAVRRTWNHIAIAMLSARTFSLMCFRCHGHAMDRGALNV